MAASDKNHAPDVSCAFCAQPITTGDHTTRAPGLGIDVHTRCYEQEYGPQELPRFHPPS